MSTLATSNLTPLGRTFVLIWLEGDIRRNGKATAEDLAAALKAASRSECASDLLVDTNQIEQAV